jgi:predicted ATPase
MSDQRHRLQDMFSEPVRYANFGGVLTRMHVRGLRCHVNTTVDISSPITAFCGLNGTGKSTLLQLAAAAYRSPGGGQRPFYIKDFIVFGPLDPHAIADDATVEYSYCPKGAGARTLTLTRRPDTRRWRGYTKRPQRWVFFGGNGLYLPRIEQRDFVVRDAVRLTLGKSRALQGPSPQWTSQILGQAYDTITANTVTAGTHTDEVISVAKGAISYSEAHMGYGEARAQFLVDTMESLLKRSLVLIEEPETSLHPSAQFEFGRYLVDVVCRKRHQVFLTSHSEYILAALPSASILYLKRSSGGIEIIPGITPMQAKSMMTEGHLKALDVLVEDQCAASVLREILLRAGPDFLNCVGITQVGGAETIQTTMGALKKTGLTVAAVRDGDKPEKRSENMFKLPGTLPPEKAIFASPAVRSYVLSTYGLKLGDFLASIGDRDLHEWFEQLAARVNQSEVALIAEMARAFVGELPESELGLAKLLMEASR